MSDRNRALKTRSRILEHVEVSEHRRVLRIVCRRLCSLYCHGIYECRKLLRNHALRLQTRHTGREHHRRNYSRGSHSACLFPRKSTNSQRHKSRQRARQRQGRNQDRRFRHCREPPRERAAKKGAFYCYRHPLLHGTRSA